MSLKKVIIILSVIFSLSFGVTAQPNLDSLYTVWQDENQPDSVRASAYYDYVWDGFLFSNPDTAFILAQSLLRFGEELPYEKAKAWAYNVMGVSKRITSDYPKALDYLHRSLKIKQEIGDTKEISSALSGIGNIYLDQGDYPKALDYSQRCLKINEEVGDKKGISKALKDIGITYKSQGDYPKALEYYQRSLKISEEIGDKKRIANSINSIGVIYLNHGNYPKALDYFQRSLKVFKEIGDQQGISFSINNIGTIYHEQGDNPKALDYYAESLKIDQEIGGKMGIARSLHNIGNIYLEQEDYPKALDYFQRSLKIEQEIGNKKGIATSLNNIGLTYQDQRDDPKALDYFQRSLKISEEMGGKLGLTYPLANIGNVYRKQGDYAKALEYCKRAWAISEEISALPEEKYACQCLYDTYKAMGLGNEALVYLEKIHVIDDSLHAEETTKALQQMEFQKVMLQDSIAKAEETRLIEEAHQEEMRQEEKTRNISFGIGGLVLLMAVALYNRLHYVRKSKAIVEKEKDRSNNLLLNILPADIAEELKIHGKAEARDFDRVSILFTDFKGFTAASEKLSASELVSEINTCFEAFDGIMEKYGIEKIKTIGDAYMAAGGLPVPTDDSVKNTVLAALEMQDFIEVRHKTRDARGEPAFQMRVGIHTGPVVAGIVGVKKFQYDIWGDTVNTASRMESASEVSKVNISQVTYELLKADPQFAFESRGKIEAKGKGEIEMYFIKLKENLDTYAVA